MKELLLAARRFQVLGTTFVFESEKGNCVPCSFSSNKTLCDRVYCSNFIEMISVNSVFSVTHSFFSIIDTDDSLAFVNLWGACQTNPAHTMLMLFKGQL